MNVQGHLSKTAKDVSPLKTSLSEKPGNPYTILEIKGKLSLSGVLAFRAKQPTRSCDLLQRLHPPLPLPFCSVEVAHRDAVKQGAGSVLGRGSSPPTRPAEVAGVKCGGGGWRGQEIAYNLSIGEGTKNREGL